MKETKVVTNPVGRVVSTTNFHRAALMSRFASRSIVAGVGLLLSAAAAGAQIPDKFENLQVLPKDIPKDQLVQTMRSFANALGVRCVHCHAAKDPQDMKTMDFALRCGDGGVH